MSASTTSTGPPTKPRRIVVLGCGIIGLTSAIRILESINASQSAPSLNAHHAEPVEVHIIADHFPNDNLDARYASTAAGAHHLSFAADDDMRQRRWDRRAFEVMQQELQVGGDKTGLMGIKQTEYMSEGTHLKIYEEHPDFKVLPKESLPDGIAHSVSFTSLTMTPSIYLSRLLERFEHLSRSSTSEASPRIAQAAHRLHRLHIDSLAYLVSPMVQQMVGGPIDLVVNCTGLGAASLVGVEDKTVYPVRGQVIRLEAPWVKEGYTRQIGSLDGGEGGQRTYVIPRVNGEVIVGGTREENDWETSPREETRRDILRRALEICPDLLPPDEKVMAGGGQEAWRRLEKLVLGDVVGFRPARQAGIRLELGVDVASGEGKSIGIVHNYGHGGAGWQSCWGCAEDVAVLVKDRLEGVDGVKGVTARL